MANTLIKISELPEVTDPDSILDTDSMPIVQVESNKLVTKRVSVLTFVRKFITSTAFRNKVIDLINSGIPYASETTAGKVKVGYGLSVSDGGILNVTGANALDNLYKDIETYRKNPSTSNYISLTDDYLRFVEAKEIPDYGFYALHCIEDINIRAPLDRIGDYAFKGNPTRSAYLFHTKWIGDYAFHENNHIMQSRFDISDVEHIGAWAFKQCGLTADILTLSKCTYIGTGAFFSGYSNYMTSFRVLNLPAIEELGEQALCAFNTSEVHLGPNFSTTGERIFGYADYTDMYGLNGLKLYIEATTPPTCSDNPLGLSNIPAGNDKFIIVPYGSVSSYKNAQYWSSYANYITCDYSNLEVKTATKASVCSFNDGADDIPCPSVLCEINPVQAGTGDPSPSNPRAISGFTGLTLTGCGINQWDEVLEDGWLDNSGQPTPYTNRMRSKNFTLIAPSTTYYVYCGANEEAYWYFYDANKNFLRKRLIRNTTTTTQSDEVYVKVAIVSLSSYSNDISFNYPSTNISYNAYSGTTLSVTWQTEAGTVYGGTLDVVSGVLSVSWVKFYFDGSTSVANIGYSSNAQKYYVTVVNPLPYGVGINSTISNAHLLSDKLLAKIGVVEGQCYITASGAILVAVLPDQTITTKQGATQWFQNNPTTFIYELATPQTYQLTPQEVNTILGTNNFYHDANGDTQVTYRADPNL